jgi:hypothetical protein
MFPSKSGCQCQLEQIALNGTSKGELSDWSYRHQYKLCLQMRISITSCSGCTDNESTVDLDPQIEMSLTQLSKPETGLAEAAEVNDDDSELGRVHDKPQ